LNKRYLKCLILVAFGLCIQTTNLYAQDAKQANSASPQAQEKKAEDQKAEDAKAEDKKAEDKKAENNATQSNSAAQTAPVANATQAAEPEVQLSPWRGTSFMYRHDVNVMSFDKSKDITYNPNYSMQYMIAPRYWLGDRFFLSTSLYIVQELTQPDDAKYKNELRWFDSSLLIGGILHRMDIGPIKTTLIGNTGIRLPLSIYSRAQSMRFGLPVGLSLNNSWKILQFGYGFGYLLNFYKYTTSQTDAPTIQNCVNIAYNCDQFSNTGIRNAKMQFTHSMFLNIIPNDKFAFSISATILQRILHDSVGTDQVNYTPQKAQDSRYVISAMLEASYQVNDLLQIAVNTWAFNPQLAPDSTYYFPFFNRFTSIGIEFRFSPTSLRALQKRLGG
jgi:hypothetical protein